MGRKLFSILMIIVLISIVSICLVSCNSDNKEGTQTYIITDLQYKNIYDAYVAYADSNGDSLLSYDEWLESIKETDGINGISAFELFKKYNPNYKGTEEEWEKWVEDFFSEEISEDQDYIEGLIFIGSKSLDGTYSVAKYEGTSKDVVIPSTYKGAKVTGIKDAAFCDCIGLTSVVLPNSITNVGDNVFDGCTGLNSITLSANITEISYGMFSGCSSLSSIEIPHGVTIIDKNSFIGCSELNSLEIPTSVTRINESAFSGCSKLSTITIPENVTMIRYDAFGDCTGLTTIEVLGGNEYVDENAFNGCSSIVTIKAPSACMLNVANKAKSSITSVEITSGTNIDNNTFKDCIKLSNIVIPNSVTTIGANAFANCTGLTSITIPENLTSIGDGAFNGCVCLADFVIPNSVTKIGTSAFENCTGLTSITIPENVASIGDGAFSNCTGLNTINWNAIDCKTTFMEYDFIQTVYGSNSKISVFNHCVNVMNINIGTSVETIPNSIFMIFVLSAASSIIESNGISIIIPNSVKTIESGAFACLKLTKIIIPSSVTKIGIAPFLFCSTFGCQGTIYCEALTKPIDWNDSWNLQELYLTEDCYFDVVWGYVEE